MGVRESERLRGRERAPEGVCVCDWGGLPEPDRNGFAKQPSTFLGECLISVRPVVVGAVVHAGHGGDGLWLGVRAERKAT